MSSILLPIAAAAAIVAGYLGFRTRIPLGGMMFAMAAAAAVGLLAGEYSLGSRLILLLQIYVGFSAGCGIDRNRLRAIKKVLPLLAILVPLYFIFDIVFGLVMQHVSQLDLVTSMFSLVPGGATDMGTIAAEMGADASVVGILQIVRVLFCSIAYPQIFGRIVKKQAIPSSHTDAATAQPKANAAQLLLAFAVAALFGAVLKQLKIPGGAILGAMLGACAVSCICEGIIVPTVCKQGLQIMGGLYLGSLITVSAISSISMLLVPSVIQVLNMILFEIVSVWLVMKFCDIDLATALPTCATGGLTEMLPLTDELGGDRLTVSTVHSLRLVIVVAAFPHLVRLVLLVV